MGLPIRDLVTPRELPWSELNGRSVAVDGYNALYQFLATIRQADGQLFTDSAGRVTSHLMGVLYRTTSLLAQGLQPVWVLDGKPSELKAATLSARFRVKERAAAEWQEALAAGDLETARRKASATSHLSTSMVAEAVALLAALGIPTVPAPSEGEAEAAYLAAHGVVWGVASEDYDSLLFGAPRLVRGLSARPRKGASAAAGQLIDREELLHQLGVSGEELIVIGLLIGSDFNEGAKGYGPKKALKLVQRHLGYEETLRTAGLDPQAERAAFELFARPDVISRALPPAAGINAEAVRELLVAQHGFDATRVEAALRRAENPPPPPAPVAPGKQSLLEAFGPG